ncbi:MAG: UbiX family flavin prenyltransferase [Methanomassiliicoccales archaeon]|nr:UbiX family flavin prenyltransferase [Methanomassiliicoccales archaeon]
MNLRPVKTVIAITGCSGVTYGVRLAEVLKGNKILVVSKTGERILEQEVGSDIAKLRESVDEWYEDEDLFAPISSGSQLFDSVVIIPCSQSTLAKISNGIADTLITRVASVALKEGRKLILVPRETPVSAVMLENELRLSRLGVTILPASPAFYHSPKAVGDLVDFVVGKVLDQLGQNHRLYKRWKRD